MRLILLALSFALVACTQPAPVAPSSPPSNAACAFARTKLKTAACVPLITSETGADTGIADFGGVVAYCAAGGGDATCIVVQDFRAQPQPSKLADGGSHAADRPSGDASRTSAPEPAAASPK